MGVAGSRSFVSALGHGSPTSTGEGETNVVDRAGSLLVGITIGEVSLRALRSNELVERANSVAGLRRKHAGSESIEVISAVLVAGRCVECARVRLSNCTELIVVYGRGSDGKLVVDSANV